MRILFALLAAAAISVSAQEAPKRGGTLVYALTNEPPHLNIAITTDLNAQQTATNIFSQLIRVDVDGRVSSIRIWARTETSSAETGSSATMTRGFSASARAMAMRCRWPPENSCGNRSR